MTVDTRAVLAAGIILSFGAAACGGAEDGSPHDPDLEGLTRYLDDAAGDETVTIEEVAYIYAGRECNREASVLRLADVFDDSGDESDPSILTAVAVDYFLCGRDVAEEVVDASFRGDEEEVLREFIALLGEGDGG